MSSTKILSQIPNEDVIGLDEVEFPDRPGREGDEAPGFSTRTVTPDHGG